MSTKKKQIRSAFRKAVFERDGYKCAMCGHAPSKEEWEVEPPPLDAHHVSDRNEMPNGGYVKENGISLCAPCHVKAEEFHNTGTAHPGYAPEDLYAKIGSSYEKAHAASLKL